MRKIVLLFVAIASLVLVGCGGGSGASELESLIVGKKYYYLDKKDIQFSDGEKAYSIIELDFKENGKIVATKTETKEQKSGLYKIDANKLTILDDNGKADEVHIYDGKFDKGIKFKFKEDDSDKYKEEVFYYTKKDAEAEGEKYASECKVDGDTLLVAEGATCKYDNHTAICQDNKITVDGSLTGEKVTINDTTYTCQ